jgi:hypothetical protein
VIDISGRKKQPPTKGACILNSSEQHFFLLLLLFSPESLQLKPFITSRIIIHHTLFLLSQIALLAQHRHSFSQHR